MKKKLLSLSVAAMAGLILSAGAARADINFQGNTMGTFSTTGTTTLGDLVYTVNTFNVTSAPLTPNTEIAGIGSAATPTLNNLGYFTLGTSALTVPAGETFNLTVTFTVPTITTPGGNPETFTANVVGSVHGSPATGGVNVGSGPLATLAFTPTSIQPVSFTDGTRHGTFTLAVNNLSVTPGAQVPVTGSIFVNANAVPEPGSLALVLPGLAPMGLLLRRRRRS